MGVVDLQRAQAAQNRLVDVVAGNPEVNGIGIARDEGGYVLKVNLRSAAGHTGIPAEVDGVTVRVQTIGRVRKRVA